MVTESDTGMWCTYFGCDPKDTEKCLKLVYRELDRLAQKPLSVAQTEKAKRQIKGQIGVACDNRESFALGFAKSFLHYGWERNIDKLFRDIDMVTPEQIHEVAQDMFRRECMTTLIFR